MGIQRALPKSNEGRRTALEKAEITKMHPPVYGNILSANVSTRLSTDFAAYNTLNLDLKDKNAASTTATSDRNILYAELKDLNSHYIQVLNFMIADKVIPAEYRAFYGIPVSSKSVPSQKSEMNVEQLAQTIIIAEPQMIAAGGKAVGYPTVSAITAKLALLKASQAQQTNALVETNNAKKAIREMNATVDVTIKKVWDEVETYFNEEAPETMRNDARVWGVVYISSGAKATLTAHVMEMINGAPVAIVGVEALLVETDDVAYTVEEGSLTLKTQATGKNTLRLSKEHFEVTELHPEIVAGKPLDLGIIVMERSK